MNARERGEQQGFALMLAYVGVSRADFEKIAQHHARHAYANPKKQAEFIEGVLSRYNVPHEKDCQCDECKRNQEEILTF